MSGVEPAPAELHRIHSRKKVRRSTTVVRCCQPDFFHPSSGVRITHGAMAKHLPSSGPLGIGGSELRQRPRRKGAKTRGSRVQQQTDAKSRVVQIARSAAATIGAEFFQAIARHLTKSLAADCALIGEFIGKQIGGVRTLGAFMDGRPFSLEYEVASSASATLACGKTCQCRAEAQARYPSDKLLQATRAQALVGLPLLDPQGHAIGLMMVLYRRPIVSCTLARTILQFLSDRAGAELSRKREQDELRESSERYRAFIAKNADAMWRVEFEAPIDTTLSEQDQLTEMYRHGYLAECNDATAALLGMEKAEEAIGFRLERLAPRSDASLQEATLNGIRRGHCFTTVEITRRDHSGNLRHLLRSEWGIVEDGKLLRIWGTTRDVTELKQVEQERDTSERRMAELLETMKWAIVMEDSEGAVSHCNKYFHRRTGWRPADITGRTWVDVMVPPEERAKLHAVFERERVKPETPVRFESTLLGPKGEQWQFDWDRTALLDAQGRVAAWANIGRDVTEEKMLEFELRQAQKLASIGTLAGGFAHDFNNLLTVILGYSCRLLEDPARFSPEVCTELGEIRKAALTGAELTNRLLAFGRRRVLRPKVLNLNSLIEDSRHMLQTLMGEQIEVAMHLDPEVGSVLIDASSFRQVLMNLAVNARDAMPKGGILTIATSPATIPTNGPSAAAPGEYVLLTVSDTGTGLGKQVREHLFEPFFTTKEQGKGTGLGLSTVYGIVQQSGGSILVGSELRKGATFRIFLPRVEGEAVLEKAADPAAGMQSASETILVVEDRADLRELAARTLRDLGYTVLEADDATRALQFVRDLNRKIRLLLTDISMPGIDGFDLADLIRAYRSEVKVLLMSGYAAHPGEVAERLAEHGFAYLQKPFSREALAAAARSLLDSH